VLRFVAGGARGPLRLKEEALALPDAESAHQLIEKISKARLS
jgi:hypothetical protein